MNVDYKTDNRKKMIRNMGIGFLLLVLLLTFFSKTINNLLLPDVETVSPYSGILEKSIEATGEVKLSDTEQIFSNGNWKIKQVKVKENDKVNKGTVLAIVDMDDLDLNIKGKELEILKMENEVENYINDTADIDMDSLKEDIDKAKEEISVQTENLYSVKKLYEKDMGKYKEELEAQLENLDSIKKQYKAGAETYQNLKKAQRQYDEAKEKAEAKTDENIKKAQRQLEEAEEDYDKKVKLYDKKILENQKKDTEFQRNLKQKEFEISYKKLELDNMKGKIPVDGVIRADKTAVIKKVSIQDGTVTNSGQLLFDIAVRSSKSYIVWKLNDKKSEALVQGDPVSFEIKYPKKRIIEGIINKKEYLPKEGYYEFTSLIDNNDSEFADEQQVEVKAKKRSGEYEIIVPNSSIVIIEGKNYVFLLKERKGSISNENYVQRVEVSVKETDDLNSAVAGVIDTSSDKVVSYSTKVLSDNMEVKTNN